MLFKVEHGHFEIYNPEKHGIWEIYHDGKKSKVREVIEAENAYIPEDIKWFKNVTNSLLGEAYLQLEENNFILNFPNRHPTNLLSPKVGEIILIYQKIDDVPCFTHLVSPTDDHKVDQDIRSNYRFGRRVKIIAKTEKVNAIPIASTLWSDVNLAGITQGNACRLDQVKGIKALDRIKLDTWQKFIPYFSVKATGLTSLL